VRKTSILVQPRESGAISNENIHSHHHGDQRCVSVALH
jgi:hypothetical protein